MKPLGDIRDHFWLTLGMAKHLKVDLGQFLETGRISQAEYADHVTRCRACPSPDHCREWLSNAKEGDIPPAYCQNLASFAELLGEPA